MVLISISGCTTQQNKEEDPDKTEASTETVQEMNNPTFYPELEDYLSSVLSVMDSIPAERKQELIQVSEYIAEKKKAGSTVNLTFICTHNSRRSHMSQIWAATAAHYYGFNDEIRTFSGGTEATAFNPRAVAAIERAGFEVSSEGEGNPIYSVKFREDAQGMRCFSKVYDDPSNPQKDFAAIMTCSDADENCPFIPGAQFRAPITYEDPKVADGTDQETARYDERCLQIATEMFYMMSQVGISS
jgi:arsenate reductase